MPLSKINTNSVANTANLSVANLGVGGASSSYSIDVNASDGVAGLHIYANTYPQIRMHDSASGNGSNDGILFEFAPNYLAIANYEARPVIFTTAGVERFRIPSNAGGITFPASQSDSSDPNTLDDYEEGTWTPTCYHEGSNNSTWGYKVGYYVKIGGILHCWWTNDSGNSGTAGSALKVSGLPFTASSANLPYGVGGVWGSNGATLTGNHFINAGSTLVQLYRGGNDYTTQQSFVSGYFTFRVA